MSKEIKKIENTGKNNVDLDITETCGPEGKRPMLQLTQGFGGCSAMAKDDEPGYIQLTERDAYLVINELAMWLKNNAKEKKEEIQQQIKKLKIQEKTIFQEAVDCEHFIEDLKIIEIPLRLLNIGK